MAEVQLADLGWLTLAPRCLLLCQAKRGSTWVSKRGPTMRGEWKGNEVCTSQTKAGLEGHVGFCDLCGICQLLKMCDFVLIFLFLCACSLLYLILVLDLFVVLFSFKEPRPCTSRSGICPWWRRPSVSSSRARAERETERASSSSEQ